jgi:CheY-like chemotaxis protein
MTSSREALARFRSDPDAFDLVITDQTMPEMAGDELARELLKIRPDLPIILCTGYSGTISEADARKIGIRAYLMKPLARHDLETRVRAVLDE